MAYVTNPSHQPKLIINLFYSVHPIFLALDNKPCLLVYWSTGSFKMNSPSHNDVSLPALFFMLWQGIETQCTRYSRQLEVVHFVFDSSAPSSHTAIRHKQFIGIGSQSSVPTAWCLIGLRFKVPSNELSSLMVTCQNMVQTESQMRFLSPCD